MFERFTDRARRVVVLAQDEARLLNHNYIGTEHILLGLIHEAEGGRREGARGSRRDPRCRARAGSRHHRRGQPDPQRPHPLHSSREEGARAEPARGAAAGHNYIGTEHILLGLLREGEGTAVKVLSRLKAEPSAVRQEVIERLSGYQGKEPANAGGPAEGQPAGSLVLDQFGRNLTQAARDGKLDPVIGRDHEAERVMQVLSRRTKNNPVLIGEPGVGKSAVVEGAGAVRRRRRRARDAQGQAALHAGSGLAGRRLALPR